MAPLARVTSVREIALGKADLKKKEKKISHTALLITFAILMAQTAHFQALLERLPREVLSSQYSVRCHPVGY